MDDTANNVPEQSQETPQKEAPLRVKRKLPYLLAAVIVVIAATVGITAFMLMGKSPGSASTTTVANGDNVSVYYTLSFTNGTVIQSNVGRTPFSFVVGSGSVITGFNDAVIGMETGQTKTVTIPPSEAYGYVNQTLHSYAIPLVQVENVSKQIYNNSNVSIGERFNLPSGAWNVTSFINSTFVLMDVHPALAGYTLVFNITIAGIKPGA